jgi:hypothetical protein
MNSFDMNQEILRLLTINEHVQAPSETSCTRSKRQAGRPHHDNPAKRPVCLDLDGPFSSRAPYENHKK